MNDKLHDPHEALRDLFEDHERGQRDSILVVDDDPITGEMVKYILGKTHRSFSVHVAEDPHQAVEKLERDLAQRVALIWTDGNMPGMHGLDFARVIRGSQVNGLYLSERNVQALSRVPIKLVTGDFDPEGHRELVESGVVQHVTNKPFHPSEIAANIRSAAMRMSRHRYP